jgi:hypothetical protein
VRRPSGVVRRPSSVVRSAGAWAAVLPILLVASGAAASQGEHAVLAGLSYDRLGRTGDAAAHGFGVRVGYRYGLRDDWTLLASASYAGFLGPGARSDLASLTVGASYLIDAVSWIPELYAAVGWFGPLARSSPWKQDFGVVGGAALEWRRVRAFGVGARLEYRWLVRNRDATPGALSVGLYVARYF